MALPPWDYLNQVFIPQNFPDIFHPLWIASLVFFVLTIVLYNVRTRQLHRHEPLRTLQEWLLWTGLSVFGLLLVATVFRFYFFVIVGTLFVGVLTFIWIRFIRFPPYIALYNEQLKRARFFSQSRRSVESTIRTKRGRGQRRRR